MKKDLEFSQWIFIQSSNRILRAPRVGANESGSGIKENRLTNAVG